MRVIIAGGRDFVPNVSHYDILDDFFDDILAGVQVEVVSGRAKGADKFGEDYAKARCLDVKLFPAQWNKYGRKAGHLRNLEMAEYADMLVAFWDGKSKGTAHMIREAKKRNLRVEVVSYE